jgi:hypothetical protein
MILTTSLSSSHSKTFQINDTRALIHKISSDDMKTVFDPVVDEIINLVTEQIGEAKARKDAKINVGATDISFARRETDYFALSENYPCWGPW